METSAFSSTMPIKNLVPNTISSYTLNDIDAAWMDNSYIQTEEVKDANITAENQ
jgi:hypothetical protein